MKQKARIQSVDGEHITAGCDRSSCEGCKGSFFCTSKGSVFEVLNPQKIELKEGDNAELELPPAKTLFTVFMSLVLPLIMFLPGYFIASFFSESELIRFISSIAGVATGFIISALYFRFTRKKYLPIVIGKEEE